jgi:hypothetical protein
MSVVTRSASETFFHNGIFVIPTRDRLVAVETSSHSIASLVAGVAERYH